jgi:hypothetical protein
MTERTTRPWPALTYGAAVLFAVMLPAAFACGDAQSNPEPGGVGGNAGSGNAGSGNAGSGNAGSGGIAGGAPLDDTPDFTLPPGRIRVTTWLEFGETELAAAFADGPLPQLREESERIGSCRLTTPRPSTCTPSCPGGSVCVAEQCEVFPAQLNRGPLEWSWPGGQQTLSATATGGYYGAGAALTTGDVVVAVDGLSFTAPIVESPSPEGDWTQALSARPAGESLTLRWANPSAGARLRLHMTDCTGTHGGAAAAEIECEAADSGQLVLPGTFLDALAAGDWSRGECGSHRLERYHVDGDNLLRLETIARADVFYRAR